LDGGTLYEDAWESKPPLFLYLYAGLFKVFGVGVLPLRLASTASAAATAVTLYFVGRRLMTERQALVAALLATLLLGVPFWEGQLALTEIFAVFPATLAVLAFLQAGSAAPGKSRRAALLFLAAGALVGVAFLLRQTAAVTGLALAISLLLSDRPVFRPAALLAAGFLGVVAPVVAAFALLGSFYWFWDANVGFFFDYVPSGEDLPLHYRPVIIAPVLAALACLLFYRRRRALPRWGLPALWLSLTLAAALLTGRPYSHYLLLAFPPLALLLALIAPGVRIAWRPARRDAPAIAFAAALAVLWLFVVIPAFHGNPLAMRYTRGLTYYENFAAWALGSRDSAAYEAYFDRRVGLTEKLDAALEALGAEGTKAYIWGEYPWVYPLASVTPATPYTTSFYVLLIPYLDIQLGKTLTTADPRFIVVLSDARTDLSDRSPVVARRYEIASRAVEALLARRYAPVAAIDRATIYERVPDRLVLPARVEPAEMPEQALLEEP
jgi:hypothetical protein